METEQSIEHNHLDFFGRTQYMQDDLIQWMASTNSQAMVARDNIGEIDLYIVFFTPFLTKPPSESDFFNLKNFWFAV